MVCQNCAAAAAAGAGIGYAMHNYATENPTFFLSPLILKFNAATFSTLFATLGYFTSAGIMSSIAYQYGGEIWSKFGPSCHSEHSDLQTNIKGNKNYIPCLDERNPDLTFIDRLNAHKITTAPIMVDENNEDNLLIASPEGSKIFVKGGLNIIHGGSGEDKFFFSMCSTKVYEGKTSVINKFEDHKDKIYLFCSKREITKQDVGTYYNEDYNTTFLTIDNPTGEVAIAVTGPHPNLLEDVYLNQKWVDFIA